MKILIDILQNDEEWLMGRILEYATKHNYTKYTSTLKEAWRLSISGLTRSIVDEIKQNRTDIALSPDDDYSDDPVAQFGIAEAQRHRKRGVGIGMFLGLLKYYRQTYKDLVAVSGLEAAMKTRCDHFIERCFDRIEIGLCSEWVNLPIDEFIAQLQASNRDMTNEKNKYLTTFESQQDPTILLDQASRIDNINQAAAELFLKSSDPGAHYYYVLKKNYLAAGENEEEDAVEFIRGTFIEKLLPWLAREIEDFKKGSDSKIIFEKVIPINGTSRYFRVKLSMMLDVSRKFNGTIIHIEDRTTLRNAEKEREKLIDELQKALIEVRKLSGLLPICSFCKKIRDDRGYWSQLESYISDRSEARFSHGLCPECINTHYPDHANKVEKKPGQAS